jgi:hypothetical protein
MPLSGDWARVLARLRRLAGWAVAAAALSAAVVVLVNRWDEVSEAGGLPGAGPVAVAVAANIVGNGCMVTAWRRVLITSGVTLHFRVALWIWAASQLSRYAIGSAQVAARGLIGRGYGLGAVTGAATALVEVAWQLAIAGTLMLATLPWWLPGSGSLEWLAWAGAPSALALLAALAIPERVLAGLRSVAGSRFVVSLAGNRVAEGAKHVSLSRVDAGELTLMYLLTTASRLVAYLTLFGAVGGRLPGQLLVAVGAHAAGQVAGRLAAFAPGGIGPREGVATLVLTPALGAGTAVLLMTATRLLEISAELASVGLARSLRPRAQAASPEGLR